MWDEDIDGYDCDIDDYEYQQNIFDTRDIVDGENITYDICEIIHSTNLEDTVYDGIWD